MKKPPILLIALAVVIIGAIVFYFTYSKKTNTSLNIGSSECGQFSNKDGYTGCMSIVSGKEKKCKFKIDNKVNETTQQMEFTYTCSPK